MKRFPMKAPKTIPLLAITALLLFLASLLAGMAGCGGGEKPSVTIGFINPNPGEKEGAQGFLRHMHRLGYVEGKNVRYLKCESNDLSTIDGSIKEMVAQKVDLIFVISGPAVQMAAKYTQGTGIPIVAVLYNAVSAGVVESLTKPGGNITGVQLRGSTPKTLEWLVAIAPGTKHLFVPVCFDTGGAKQSLADLEQAVAPAGFKLTVSEVKTGEELRAAMDSMPVDAEAVFLLHSWLLGSHLQVVLDAARQRRMPTVSAGHVNYDDGLLLSYGPLDDRIGAQAARLTHGILSGTPPAELPMETSGFSLGINLRTAGEIGLEIPNDILQQADAILR